MPERIRSAAATLRLRALERRILLDAAALATGVDAMADASESEPPAASTDGGAEPRSSQLLAALAATPSEVPSDTPASTGEDGPATPSAAPALVGAPTSAAPVITGLDGDSVIFTEGDENAVLDGGTPLTLTDADSTDFNGGTIRVTPLTGWARGDFYQLDTTWPPVGPGPNVYYEPVNQGAEVYVDGVHIGDRSGGLLVSLNENATVERIETVLRKLAYFNWMEDTPAPGVRTAGVTVSDGDGGVSLQATVTLTVVAVNDAPTVSAIEDQTLQFGEPSVQVPFTIADPETSLNQLAVTVDGQALPESSFIVTGSGAQRMLEIRPPDGFAGSVPVTVTVSDGEISSSTSFILLVTDPPPPDADASTPSSSFPVTPVEPPPIAPLPGVPADAPTPFPVTFTNALSSAFDIGGAAGAGSGFSPDAAPETLTFGPGAAVSFDIPLALLQSLDGRTVVAVEAALTDGSALPEWLTFDPQTGTFIGAPPAGAAGSYELGLTVRDDLGNESSMTITVTIEGAEAIPDGLPSADARPSAPATPPPDRPGTTPASQSGKPPVTDALATAGEHGRQIHTSGLLHALTLGATT